MEQPFYALLAAPGKRPRLERNRAACRLRRPDRPRGKEEAAMNVENILRSKGGAVAKIAPRATIRDAAAVLRRERIGALVVSSDGANVDRILSERDIVHRPADRGAPP